MTDEREFISVGELSDGFSENILPATDALVGSRITLYFESGKKATITFVDRETLQVGNGGTGIQGEVHMFFHGNHAPERRVFCRFYRILRGQPIDLGHSRYEPEVCDGCDRHHAQPPRGNDPPHRPGGKGDAADIRSGNFRPCVPRHPLRAISSPRHEKTSDLVGHRMQWIYSSKDAYEHIYLNESRYTWHCISGNEKGLADTDTCFFYKLAERLYLLYG